MRASGKIKWYSVNKKFGFITNDKSNDVFFKLENIQKSIDSLDEKKEREELIPEIGDSVEYTEYENKNQLKAKKITIKQRKHSVFICPHCNEKIKPKIVFENDFRDNNIGNEFEKSHPMYTICPNCFEKLDEYNTIYEDFSNHNRAALLLLILVVVSLFLKLFVVLN